MIDWHSHILPNMDDGSRDVAESLALIDMQASQGVSTVMATPHFHANDESVESFLDRRRRAFELLKADLSSRSPDIILGAEVRYYQGISRLSDIKDLRVEGSNIFLLEMPMSKWTEYMVRELIEMSAMSGMKVVLAHIERYRHLQSRNVWARIADSGILMQVNASFFTSLGSRYKALSLLQKGHIHFVGSDCHNIASRPPQIGKAFEIIQKKFGANFISQMNEYGYSVLEHKEKLLF